MKSFQACQPTRGTVVAQPPELLTSLGLVPRWQAEYPYFYAIHMLPDSFLHAGVPKMVEFDKSFVFHFKTSQEDLSCNGFGSDFFCQLSHCSLQNVSFLSHVVVATVMHSHCQGLVNRKRIFPFSTARCPFEDMTPDSILCAAPTNRIIGMLLTVKTNDLGEKIGRVGLPLLEQRGKERE